MCSLAMEELWRILHFVCIGAEVFKLLPLSMLAGLPGEDVEWQILGDAAVATDLIRFGDFELDARNYCLRRSGDNLKLERIPLELLLLLAGRAGELVSREEIIEKLWGKGVYLDTESAINTAIRKIRLVLGDDPAQPRF